MCFLFTEICSAGQEIADFGNMCNDCDYDFYQNIMNPFPFIDLCQPRPENTGTAAPSAISINQCMCA